MNEMSIGDVRATIHAINAAADALSEAPSTAFCYYEDGKIVYTTLNTVLDLLDEEESSCLMLLEELESAITEIRD